MRGVSTRRRHRRTTGVCGARRVLLRVAVVLACAGTGAGPAAAQVGTAVDGLRGGVWVADGLDVDRAALESVVREVAGEEDVVIAVFDAVLSGSAASRAQELLAMVPADTVLLFTPADVAVASRSRDPAAVDAALGRAGDAALAADVPAASRAILAELLAPPRTRWPVVVVAVVLLLTAGTAALRLRARQAEQQARATFERAHRATHARIEQLAARILVLEHRLAEDDDPDPARAARLAEVTGLYQDALWSLDRAHRPAQVVRIDEVVGEAERALDDLAPSS